MQQVQNRPAAPGRAWYRKQQPTFHRLAERGRGDVRSRIRAESTVVATIRSCATPPADRVPGWAVVPPPQAAPSTTMTASTAGHATRTGADNLHHPRATPQSLLVRRRPGKDGRPPGGPPGPRGPADRRVNNDRAGQLDDLAALTPPPPGEAGPYALAGRPQGLRPADDRRRPGARRRGLARCTCTRARRSRGCSADRS